MMKLNKRNRRVFYSHRASYLGMLLLIVLSTACYLGFKTSTVSITQNVEDNRENQNVEDASFSLYKPLSQDEIDELEHEFELIIEEKPAIEIEMGYNNAALRLIPKAEQINKPLIFEGEMLEHDNEVMVDRFFSKAQKLNGGDSIRILGKEYKIGGIFTTPNYLLPLRKKTDFMANGNMFGIVMMTQKEFSRIDYGGMETQYAVVFSFDNETEFRERLSTDYGIAEWIGKDANICITGFDGENAAIVMMSIIAPLFILVVSAIIMAIVLSRMLKQEYAYIGTLVALGYRKREIFAHYLQIPVMLTLAGEILGIGLGFLLIKPFSFVTRVEYNIPKPDFVVKTADIVILLFVPILLNSLLCSCSIIKALTINTVGLLKASGGSKAPSVLARAVPKKVLSFKARFKLKEITTNISRSLMMLLGIIVASLFMITGFLFYSTIDFLLASNYNNLFGYEYQYLYEEIQDENETDGEPFMMASYYAENRKGQDINFTIHGTADDTKFISLYDESGKKIDADKTVISKSIAKRMGWEKGDEVRVISNVTLKSSKLTIDDIADIRYGEYVFMPMERLNAMLHIGSVSHIGLYATEQIAVEADKISETLTRMIRKAA